MKLRSLRLDDQPQLMIIPMIDIIFFLLVFFMMSTLYMVEQHSFPVNLPSAAATRKDIIPGIDVTVTQSGQVMVDREEIPLELLQKRIRMELIKQPERSFILRGDRQVEYGRVIAVLDRMRQAGASRIAVAAEWEKR